MHHSAPQHRERFSVVSGMGSPKPRIERKFGIITAGVIALIVYGSLYPFDFYSNPQAGGSLHALLATHHSTDRGNFLANVVLYLPLGFFAAQALWRMSSVSRILLVTFVGVALSVGVELAQFFDRSRDAGISDVYANGAGAAFGAIAAVFLRREPRLPLAEKIERRPFIVLLVVCWLAYRLFPYWPSLDPQKYWDALRPLVSAPTLPVLDLYRNGIAWLAVAVLLEAVFGIARSRVAMPVLVSAVLVARILIVQTVLSPAEVLGGALAAFLWIVLFSRLRTRAFVIAALLIGLVAVDALDPFRFSTDARPFGLIPFRSFMTSSRENGVRVFFQKAFTYGSLVWLMARAGCPWKIAAVIGTALVLCLRIAQIYLPGRSAEITDVIMLLMLVAMMRLLNEAPGRPAVEGE